MSAHDLCTVQLSYVLWCLQNHISQHMSRLISAQGQVANMRNAKVHYNSDIMRGLASSSAFMHQWERPSMNLNLHACSAYMVAMHFAVQAVGASCYDAACLHAQLCLQQQHMAVRKSADITNESFYTAIKCCRAVISRHSTVQSLLATNIYDDSSSVLCVLCRISCTLSLAA
jgi:hypothetical protein